MSGQVPRQTVGPVLGASTLPITGPADTAVQIAVFVAVVLATWFVADLLASRHKA